MGYLRQPSFLMFAGYCPERAESSDFLKSLSESLDRTDLPRVIIEVTGPAHAHIGVDVPRVIVAIHSAGTTVGTVVPVAASNQGVEGK